MISIKKVGIEAIPIVNKLANEIWPVSYKNIITNVQIDYMLDIMYSPVSLKEQILEKKHQFIIAYKADKPVGYLSYSIKNQIENTTYRLHKLYVAIDQQGKGIGKSLLDYMIADILPVGATQIQLNVNKHNPSVIFYKKNGFTVLEEEMLNIGNGFFMDDYIMQLMC